MKETLEILAFGPFGIWLILIPMIMIMKYFKAIRHNRYHGTSDLFSFLTPEWWIAGITFGFPIFGKEENPEIEKIKTSANKRLFAFYGTIIFQIIIVGILTMI